MNRPLVTLALVGMLALTASWCLASGDPPYSLEVKRSHLVGSSSGTLRITSEGVDYETAAKNETRRWTYPDIKQLQIRSPKSIVVLTYEDQGRLKFGADRSFEFKVLNGSVTPEMVAFLLSQTNRPIVTAVLPPRTGTPLFSVPVKHERQGRGSDGALLMYTDALVYTTEHESESRYWRFTDLYAALLLDPYRFQVSAYEGGAGDVRTFDFLVKTALPDGFARTAWERVNRSSSAATISVAGSR